MKIVPTANSSLIHSYSFASSVLSSPSSSLLHCWKTIFWRLVVVWSFSSLYDNSCDVNRCSGENYTANVCWNVRAVSESTVFSQFSQTVEWNGWAFEHLLLYVASNTWLAYTACALCSLHQFSHLNSRAMCKSINSFTSVQPHQQHQQQR